MRLAIIRKVLWALAGAGAIAYAALLVWTSGREPAQQARSEPPFHADFELTDHAGTVRSDEDFAGNWMLVFFGFANCPDICPTTLADVSIVMDRLGEEADRVRPLFITIDPQRDTVAELASYVPRFDPRIVGLTGTADQIARTAKTFRIYYERLEEAAAPDGYTMSHSSQLFLFGPEAGYVTSYAYGTPVEEVVADLRDRVS
ncbi:SCO family protein [Acuticoccus yangtzensis]|uniref:SCO family protein n=1 Tax=Acuticoccus yangtzensis TaxID=1443441 RepID=UPI000A8BDECE|nr:SCO family protein [Acuticoccus yangtzensis]